MSQSRALASLIATYTDSEGEEEGPEDAENQGAVTLNSASASPENKSTPTSRPSRPIPTRVTTKVAKLVSYHDDTVVSDEDADPDEAKNSVTVIDKESATITESVEDDGMQLPPEPTGECSLDLQDKIKKLYEKMQNNALDMNNVIQQRKDFRNPSIYEKLIQFCGINELGTNYPPEMYDHLLGVKNHFMKN